MDGAYDICFVTEVGRTIGSMSGPAREQFIRAMRALSDDPFPPPCIRQGPHGVVNTTPTTRIAYTVYERERTVVIVELIDLAV